MLLTAVLCDGKKGKTPGARERVSSPFPLSGLPAPPALRPVDGAHGPHRAGAPALRGGRHPQRCRLAGLCEGWAGVRAFWPAVSPGCRGDVLPCPCCNSCCPGGCRALWPAHRRPLPAFQGAVVLWTPVAEEGGWRGLLQGALTQRLPPAGCRRRWGDLGALALPLLPRRADGGFPFPLLDVSCILDSLSMIGCGGGEGGTCCRPRSTSARATGFSTCLPRFLHPAAAFLPPFCLWHCPAEGAMLASLDRRRPPGCGTPLCEIEEPAGESGRSAAAGYCSDIYDLYIVNMKLQILLFASSAQGAPHQRQKGGAEGGVSGRKSGRARMLLSPTVPLAAHCANARTPRAEGGCSRVALAGTSAFRSWTGQEETP